MTLYPARRRHLGLLAASVLLVAVGGWLIRAGDAFGWVCIVFFGLGAVAAAANLLPGRTGLHLDATGMELRSVFRSRLIRWDEVEAFFPAEVADRVLVCWDHAPGYTAQPALRAISLHMVGAEACLPDTYGLTPQALAALLNRWRREHAGGPAGAVRDSRAPHRGR
jgi:hypothetical protein